MEIGQAEDGAVAGGVGHHPKSSTVSECRAWEPSDLDFYFCLLVLSDSGQVI